MRDRQTDTQTAVANIHFASAMPYAKCNKLTSVYDGANGGRTLSFVCERSPATSVVSRLLWPPYGIGQAILFLPCGFFLSSSSSFFLA